MIAMECQHDINIYLTKLHIKKLDLILYKCCRNFQNVLRREQARNPGGETGRRPPRKILAPSWKNLLDII